jgi:hypothetical protein
MQNNMERTRIETIQHDLHELTLRTDKQHVLAILGSGFAVIRDGVVIMTFLEHQHAAEWIHNLVLYYRENVR